MKKAKNKLIRFLTISVLPFLLIGAVILTGAQAKVQPKNPLTEESSPSKMLPNGGESIGLDEEYLANLGNADINKAEVPDDKSDDTSLEANDEKDGKVIQMISQTMLVRVTR